MLNGLVLKLLVSHDPFSSFPFVPLPPPPHTYIYNHPPTSLLQVGLAVDPNAISKIITTNQALLDRLNASDMPQDATYRTNIEAIAKHRIQICQDHPTDPEAVEEAVQMGQVEELVEQAEKEMAVLEMYLDRRMWECVEQVDIQFDPERDDAKKEEEE